MKSYYLIGNTQNDGHQNVHSERCRWALFSSIASLTFLLVVLVSFASPSYGQDDQKEIIEGKVNAPAFTELEEKLIKRNPELLKKPGLGVSGRSCSSGNGKKDCFCVGGCWRTATDCGCTANLHLDKSLIKDIQ